MFVKPTLKRISKLGRHKSEGFCGKNRTKIAKKPNLSLCTAVNTGKLAFSAVEDLIMVLRKQMLVVELTL